MKKETIKEKISWYKLLFTVLATATAACIGWFVGNYSTANLNFVVLDIIGYTGFMLGLAFCLFRINFYIKKLEESKDV